MSKDALSVQEVATVVRVSLVLWTGPTGPKEFGNVFNGTLFVRDNDFIVQMAADIRMDAAELWRMLKEVEDEGAERRRSRGEALVVAEKVCGVAARLRKNHGDRWQFFQKMVRGQTLGQLSRRVKREDRGVARASCAWCAGRFREIVGDSELERVLTFRNIVG